MLSCGTGLASMSPVKHSRCNRWAFPDFPLWKQLHLMINSIGSQHIWHVLCVFVAHAVPSPQSSDKGCAFHACWGIADMVLGEWNQPLAKRSGPKPMHSVYAGVTSESRHLGVQIPWLFTRLVPSVTHQHLPSVEQSRCVFCFLWRRLCRSLCNTSMECWHSEKPEISALIPRQISG